MPILQDIKLQRGQDDVTKIVRDGDAVYVKRDPAPLKLFNNVLNVYSMRKVILDYTGPAIRVRRSSDDAEQDIGFVGVDLDIAALLSFVAGGDGFVTIIYDQSGNGKDIAQTTNSSQASLVTSGLVNLLNGKPALSFDGTDDHYIRTPPAGELNSGEMSWFIVLQSNDPTAGQLIVGYNRNATIFFFTGTGASDGEMRFFSQPNQVSASYEDGEQIQVTCLSADGVTDGSKLFINGILGGEFTDVWGATTSDNAVVIGANRIGASSFADMLFQEILIFDDDNETNRTVIENNQNVFYGMD